MLKITRNLCSTILLSLASLIVFADSSNPTLADLEALSKKAIAKSDATASTPPTPELIMQKVREAAKLISTEGPAAFPKFRGDTEFVFGGTYVWVHGMDDDTMYAHPIKYKMEGTNLANLKDAKGKLFFVEMNSILQKSETGEAWIEYSWPRPGQQVGSPKVSFLKKAVFQGKTYVIGCGVYDIDMTKVKIQK
jgi:signal transduction histidine kinase